MRLKTGLSKLLLTTVFPVFAGLLMAFPAHSQDTVDQYQKETSEPVFRVSKLPDGNLSATAVETDRNASVEPNRSVPVVSPTNSIVQPFAGNDLPNNALGNNRNNSTARLPLELIPNGNSDSASPEFQPNAAPVNPTPVVGNLAVPALNSGAVTPVPFPAPAAAPPHPLDRAIVTAREALDHIRTDIADYTAILVKRERVDGVLGDTNYMQVKIRNGRQTATGAAPFGVYMKFIRPQKAAGREVIYVAGQNNGNLIAHENTALLRFKDFVLEPTGMLAMRGNRHPITDCGIENLVLQLIEKAERDRQAGDCVVEYRDNGSIADRPCSVIELIHPDRQQPFEFHMAQVFIDQELNIPVRYAAYDWPQTPGGKPVLLEEYTYVNIELNVGLTDEDFSTHNPNYGFTNR